MFVSVAKVKLQLKLEVLAISSQKQEIIYCMVTMTFYKIGEVFSSFYDEDYAVFIHRLNPMYKLPSTQLFSRQLLDEVYDDVQGQLQIVLDKYTYFNFVTDSLANI